MLKRSIIILALMLLGALLFVPTAYSYTLYGSSWSMYRHDLRHTGATWGSAPSVANVRWKVETGGDVCGSAAVVNGRVYIGAGCSEQRTVLCLNAWTGAVVWNQTVGGTICSSPAVRYGRVYIGTMYQEWDPEHGIENPYGDMGVGGVYCLDARTGRICWSYLVGQWAETYTDPVGSLVGQFLVVSSPAVVGGRVYVGSSDCYVYCLNAFTGNLIWNCSTSEWVDSSPAIYCGRVYIGDEEGYFYCLDTNMGNLIWDRKLDASIWCSPAVVNGKVYVGTRDYSAHNGTIYCLAANTGEELWKFPMMGSVMSSPAIAYGNLYIGTEAPDGSLYCLDANTGTFKWKYETEGNIHHSSPAVAQRKVYIGSWGYLDDPVGYTHCVNAFTGSFAWKYPSAPDGYHSSSPVVAYGMVFTAADNFIYAFSVPPAAAKVNTRIFFTLNPNPARPGQRVVLSGILKDVLGSPGYPARVKVEYSMDSGRTWRYLWTLSTNTAGEFSRIFTAPRVGRYLLRASYAGSSRYNPSSNTETLTIQW